MKLLKIKYFTSHTNYLTATTTIVLAFQIIREFGLETNIELTKVKIKYDGSTDLQTKNLGEVVHLDICTGDDEEVMICRPGIEPWGPGAYSGASGTADWIIIVMITR